MKFDVKKLISETKAPMRRVRSAIHHAWEGYGYYISLAALIVMFASAAYLYRNGKSAKIPELREYEPAVRAMEQFTPAPSPTPVPPEKHIMPVNGDITVGFANDQLIWNETLGQWRVHAGVDITAPAGSAVIASRSGTVRDSRNDSLYGYVVEIIADDGSIDRYCSLSTIELAPIGKAFSQGDIISAVSDSAIIESNAGSHLHFETERDGVLIEPVFE